MTDDVKRRPGPGRRGPILLGFGLVVLIAVTGCGTPGVPLPKDVKVIPPSAGTPRRIAAFSGKWVGTWDIKLDHVMVVERIEGNRAYILYAWGAVKEWGLKAGFTRDVGTIKGDLLKVVRSNSSIVDYRLSKEGDRLDARYERLGRVSHAVMWRPGRLKTH